MEVEKIAVGLDIGTTKIVAMLGRKNEHGKIEILGMGRAKSRGVHRGVVNNITQTIDSINEAVREAERNSGLKIHQVIVGIAGQHIRSLEHSDYITREDFEEVIAQEDLRRLIGQVHKLVMLPGEEIIHVLPQEYKVDSQAEVREPMGMYGSRLEANFHVVLGQTSSIRNIGRCVKAVGLNLSAITLEPLASAEAVLSREEKEAGVALVDIGGGTTDIAIFKDNIIRHTAVIPFGGNIITEDIKEGCFIIKRQAELLKVKFGSAWPGENKETEIVSIPGLRGREPREISLKRLSQIINARVKEIIEQVYMEIQNYGHEDQKKRLIGGLVLTGGGSKLKHLRQLAEYITGVDTRIGYASEHLSNGKDHNLNNPEYTTAIGLVMKGFEKSEENQEITTNNSKESVSVYEENLKGTRKISRRKPTEISEENLLKKKAIERSKSFLENWADKFRQILNDSE
ncbi:cell division protein FtsA [Bacteroidetes bacterium endosymbiont of Geopemphigus sp.]|uniref:cell division protein FtsA n=1 Tax=Bacteroidetes bacterium endosymbiont of Geopemphigus sp. TaxID=2047937 RepID=UPI000CD1F349|nr:cell division protein FtsA [Bacteroidetes bacterium endosymbiont of Geopemphigus sp.]